MEYIPAILANQSSRDTYLCIDTGEYISSRRLGCNYFINDEYKFVTRSEELFEKVKGFLPPSNTKNPSSLEFFVEEINGGYITLDRKYILNGNFVVICRGDGSPLTPTDTEYLFTQGVVWESVIPRISYEDPRINVWMSYVKETAVPCCSCFESARIGSAVLVDATTRACPPTNPDTLPPRLPWGVWECWHCHFDEVRVFD